MATVVFVWMVSIGSNVLFYTVIALLLWPFARARSEGPSVDKEQE